MSDTAVNNQIKLTIFQVKPLIKACMNVKILPMIHGSPGLGKSGLFKQIAKEANLKLIDIRLTNYDPTSMHGFPGVDMEKGRSFYFPPGEFPIEGDDLPVKDLKGFHSVDRNDFNTDADFIKERNKHCYQGWLILFDELTSAVRAVQAAAYRVILDRQVGNFDLHDRVWMCAAGNKATDGAIVTEMSTALKSRMAHYEVMADVFAWAKHAEDNDFAHQIVSYTRWKKMVSDFKADSDDYTYMCPRTLEMASKLVKNMHDINTKSIPLLAGVIGMRAATEFVTFCEVYAKLPTVTKILNDPENVPVPKDAATVYALTGILSRSIDNKNISTMMVYIERMTIEFQIITLRGVIKKDPTLVNDPAVSQWAVTHATRLNS